MLSLRVSGSTAIRASMGICGTVLFVFCWDLQTAIAQRQAPTLGRHDAAAPKPDFQRVKDLLAPARKKLQQQKIPFDPYIAVEDDWRRLVDSALLDLPEMKRNLHVTESLKGVYLADTLLVGEDVKLKGDTVLLIRELAPDDENRDLRITGVGDFFMFIIGNGKRIRLRGVRGTILVETIGKCAVVGSTPGYIVRLACGGGWGFVRP